MAIGFPAYHQESKLISLEKETILSLAKKALDQLGWKELGAHKEVSLDYRTIGTAMTLAERILVDVHDQTLIVRSECLFPTQFLDFGKNKRNIAAFWETFENICASENQN